MSRVAQILGGLLGGVGGPWFCPDPRPPTFRPEMVVTDPLTAFGRVVAVEFVFVVAGFRLRRVGYLPRKGRLRPARSTVVLSVNSYSRLRDKTSGRENVYCRGLSAPSYRKSKWKRWGTSPPTFSSRFCGRSEPLRIRKPRFPARKLYCITESKPRT